MRIHRLHIDGFGHFANRDFGPFESSLNVIEGVNEAGKSTLLAFIRMVCFGWPQQKRVDHYPPLRGGRHGGWIDLLGPGGDIYKVERWEDGHTARLLLTLPGGAQTSDEHALAHLLGNASKGMFEEVFAFDTDALRGLSGEANSAIFEAGMGVRALPKALDSIEKRSAELFKPSGHKQKAANLLHELKAVKTELDQVDGQAAEYGRLTRRVADLQVELATAEAAVADVASQQREHAPLLKGWDAWVRSRRLHGEIEALPAAADFPPDGIERLNAAEVTVRHAREAFDGAQRDLDRWHSEASAAIPHAPLLSESAGIADLKDRLSWYKDRADTLPKRTSERDSAQAALENALRELGPGWDAERVLAFDASVQVQHEVQEHRATIDNASQQMNLSRADEQRTAVEAGAAAAAVRDEQAKADAIPKPALDSAALRERRVAVRECRGLTLEHVRVQSELAAVAARAGALGSAPSSHSRGRRTGVIRAAATASIALAMLIVVAVGANGTVPGAIITTGVEVILASALVWAWRAAGRAEASSQPDSPLATELEAARSREQQALARLVAAAARLGLQAPSGAELDTIEARLDSTSDAIAGYEAQVQALAAAEEALHRAETAHGHAVAAFESAQHLADAAWQEWREWLAGHSLEQSLKPELVALLLGRVANARTLVTDLRDKQHRVAAIRDDIEAYNALAAALHARLEMPVPGRTSAAVIAAITTLASRYSEAVTASEARMRARAEAAAAREVVDEKAQATIAAEARLAALLRTAGVSDIEAFRALAAMVEQRRTLQRQLADCTTQLTTLSGPGPALDRFEKALAATDRPALDERTTALAAALTEVQSHREDLRDERSACQVRLSQLVDGVQMSELLARRAALVDELRAVAQEWAALAVARHVLGRARRRWEEERQPAVVREASDLFAEITGQRYSRIVPQLESKVLKVAEAASGRQKEASQLSRGTREQLYLALRFGLIRQFATPLPVIVDEVLINFDAERCQRVAGAFARLAETNQVLVFTCHEWVADMFERAAACHVISLSETDQTASAVPVAPRLFAEIS